MSLLTMTDCAYGIRFAELNKRDQRRPWSIRQTSIYHKYRTETRASTWVMVAASKSLETNIDRYVRSCTDIPQLNPFEIHVLILDNALVNWRQCILHLTERATQQVRKNLLRLPLRVTLIPGIVGESHRGLCR